MTVAHRGQFIILFPIGLEACPLKSINSSTELKRTCEKHEHQHVLHLCCVSASLSSSWNELPVLLVLGIKHKPSWLWVRFRNPVSRLAVVLRTHTTVQIDDHHRRRISPQNESCLTRGLTSVVIDRLCCQIKAVIKNKTSSYFLFWSFKSLSVLIHHTVCIDNDQIIMSL